MAPAVPLCTMLCAMFTLCRYISIDIFSVHSKLGGQSVGFANWTGGLGIKYNVGPGFAAPYTSWYGILLTKYLIFFVYQVSQKCFHFLKNNETLIILVIM